MTLFDQSWKFENERLCRVGDPRLVVPCARGLVRVHPDGNQPSDLERVFDAMGFGPDDAASSESCQSFRDRLNRRLKETITIGFPFPPTSVRWEVIRLTVDDWWTGPANDAENIEFPEVG